MLGPFATASRRTPIHQVSLLSHAACASMSTTTTTTTRDRGDRYGPIEWAQLFYLLFYLCCLWKINSSSSRRRDRASSRAHISHLPRASSHALITGLHVAATSAVFRVLASATKSSLRPIGVRSPPDDEAAVTRCDFTDDSVSL